MARYIDADKIQFYLENEGDTTIEYAYKSDIDAIPTADVRPERHGEWFGTVCSACGESISFYYDCDYCPCCGAKMDGKVCENDG